jgi:hypothetical protein
MTRLRRLVLITATATSVALTASAAAGQTPGQQPGTSNAPRDRGGMQMMAERSAEMAAADKRLDELVQAMQSAKGAAKVDSLAAVVVELVAQHKAMHGRMARMGETMRPADATPGGDHPASPGDDAHKH